MCVYMYLLYEQSMLCVYVCFEVSIEWRLEQLRLTQKSRKQLEIDAIHTKVAYLIASELNRGESRPS